MDNYIFVDLVTTNFKQPFWCHAILHIVNYSVSVISSTIYNNIIVSIIWVSTYPQGKNVRPVPGIECRV